MGCDQGDVPIEGTASDNIAYECDGSRNGQPFKCVVSVIPPVSVTQFVGIEAIIDIYLGSGPSEHPIGPLPDFWRLGVGECRDGNLIMPMTTIGVGGTSCVNTWSGASTGGGYQYTSYPDHGRMHLTFARSNSVSLTGGQQYVGMVFAFDTVGDTEIGYGECPGCCSSVAIVANQVNLYQVAGTPPQDIFYLTSGERPWVTWQSTNFPHQPGCVPSPTRRTTWGSIKATYR